MPVGKYYMRLSHGKTVFLYFNITVWISEKLTFFEGLYYKYNLNLFMAWLHVVYQINLVLLIYYDLKNTLILIHGVIFFTIWV